MPATTTESKTLCVGCGADMAESLTTGMSLLCDDCRDDLPAAQVEATFLLVDAAERIASALERIASSRAILEGQR